MTMDNHRNKLYIVGGMEMIYTFDGGNIKGYVMSVDIGQRPVTAFVNGKLHIISGGQKNWKHFVWDEGNKTFKLLHAVKETSAGLQNAAMVHVKSQNKLILLGGYDWAVKSAIDTIRVYSIADNEWKVLLNKNGNAVKLPLTLAGFGCVLSRDEKYIVVFGGTSGMRGGEEVGIYYLDLKTLTWSKSLVECPVNNEFEAVLTYNNDVHIFARFRHDGEQNGHWRIGLKDIIPKYGFDLVCGYVRLNCANVSEDLIKLIHS